MCGRRPAMYQSLPSGQQRMLHQMQHSQLHGRVPQEVQPDHCHLDLVHSYCWSRKSPDHGPASWYLRKLWQHESRCPNLDSAWRIERFGIGCLLDSRGSLWEPDGVSKPDLQQSTFASSCWRSVLFVSWDYFQPHKSAPYISLLFIPVPYLA